MEHQATLIDLQDAFANTSHFPPEFVELVRESYNDQQGDDADVNDVRTALSIYRKVAISADEREWQAFVETQEMPDLLALSDDEMERLRGGGGFRSFMVNFGNFFVPQFMTMGTVEWNPEYGGANGGQRSVLGC